MEQSSLAKIHEEVSRELATPEVVNSLMEARFKGLTPDLMKRAIVEGMIKGFKLKDFFEGNVYAIPYKMKKGEGQYELTYSLVTSLDNSRKIGAKSGIVGVDAPIYGGNDKDGGVWCSVTVHKQFPSGYIGDFTAKVYLIEYSTGKNLWVTKERTMIAKVAEMHALRKACPELAESYIAEEIERPVIEQKPIVTVSIEEAKAKLGACKNLEDLGAAWSALPAEFKASQEFEILKEDIKLSFPA